MSKAHADAGTKEPTKFQSLWRGRAVRVELVTQLVDVVAKASINVSKENQKSALPCDEKGELLPITCSLKCFKVFGSGVYAYMRWQYFMFQVFSVAFAFSLPNMIHNIFGGKLEAPSWMTIHTLGNLAELNASYGVAEMLVTITFVVALFRGRTLIKASELEVEREADASGTVEESTVWLRGLPSSTAFEELKATMQQFGPCTLVLGHANRELLLRMNMRRPLLEDLHYRNALLYVARHATDARFPDAGSRAEAIKRLMGRAEEARARLSDHDHVTADMTRASYPCSGDAFVTFASPIEANQCINAIGNSPQTALQRVGCSPSTRLIEIKSMKHRAGGEAGEAGGEENLMSDAALKVAASQLPDGVWAQEAPAPSDIMWADLATPDGERFRRQVISTTLTLLIACFGTAIITVMTYVQGTGIIDGLIDMPGGFVGLILTLIKTLLLALPCILGNVFLFATTPIFSDKIERHRTFSEKEATLFGKLAFFQIFNTVTSAFIFLVSPVTHGLLGREWYALGGATIATVVGPLGDCILLPSLLDWLTVDMPIRRLIFAPRQKTQLGMDRLYLKESGLYLAFRVHLACKFVVICLMFGTPIPILYLYGALFFGYGMLIDRHNLLRNQTPPPRTSAKLTAAAHNFVFPIAIVTHGVMAVIFFYHLSLDDVRRVAWPPMATWPDWSYPPPSPPLPPPSAPYDIVGAETETVIHMALVLAIGSTAIIVGFLCYYFPPEAIRKQAQECCYSWSEMRKQVPLADRIRLPNELMMMQSGSLKNPSIREPPRQTYLPPTLSATLLASFRDAYIKSNSVSQPNPPRLSGSSNSELPSVVPDRSSVVSTHI